MKIDFTYQVVIFISASLDQIFVMLSGQVELQLKVW